ncbi:type IV pilin-like G/H family protein [Anabaena sp. CCY 0017]|uniref:type IV pilin-like G/H family protein n=1 Tax=Anabaena sp. CCY 0017 TaxID=3103866 RepID=UPI0039C712DF
MKSELKAKFLQHIQGKKKNEEGFTLIELLVVIIIIGILSAIALPSFLNQAAKAKQSEAKTYVGSVNRAQQSYRIANPSFATDVESLEIGIPTSTVDYDYEVVVAETDATSTIFEATTKDAASLRSYAGGVVILANGQTSAAACQTTEVSATPPDVTVDPALAAAACETTNHNMR